MVTINCARLGYLFAGEAGLFARLGQLADMARDSLEIKRKVVQRLMDDGLFPYTRRYLGTLRNHFSTIGVNGVNEMVRNFTCGVADIQLSAGPLALRLLDFLRERMRDYQEGTGNLYNLEATPAEGTTYRFAREDAGRYPDILRAGTLDAPYYTNSTQLPVRLHRRSVRALQRQDELQTRYTGGTVLHLYMRERDLLAGSLPPAGAHRAVPVPAALHHRDADLLDLPEARLPQRRARVLPALRRGDRDPAPAAG